MKKVITKPCEIAPGIYRISLPLPGEKPGPVNAYIFLGKHITLLDTGMLGTVDTLRESLNQIGIGFSDIKQIVLTHGHFDHCGAAKRIVREAGGGIFITGHEADQNLVEHGLQVSRKQYTAYLRLMGLPNILLLSLELVRRSFSLFAEHTHIDKFLSDGEKITLGNYQASVISTPGHTRGSISLYLKKENILFAGDHILGHITPNAFVMLEPDLDLPKRSSQAEYYDSLNKIERLSPRIVYPAHGEPVANLDTVIAKYKKLFTQRQKKILSILGSGESTVYKIARTLFPHIKGFQLPFQIFLTVSEVYTHLQVLEKEKKVAWKVKNGVLCIKKAY